MTSVALYPNGNGASTIHPNEPSEIKGQQAGGTADRAPDVSGETWQGWFNELPTSTALAFTPNKLESVPGVVISDVDSTLIEEEVIDQLAHIAGVGPQVAAVTESAMRGELDFAQSLTHRVKLLEGLPITAFHEVADSLHVRPGAKILVDWVHAHGGIFAAVSGGFTPIVSILAKKLGIDFFRANDFEIENERLTGRVQGSIITAQTKLETLQALKHDHKGPVLALGDGANDILMLQAADLGIAVLAKPKVKATVGSWIETNDLSSVIGLAGCSIAQS